jgi:hypothetical protein
MSDIEGKVAREAMSECGQRASFKTFGVVPRRWISDFLKKRDHFFEKWETLNPDGTKTRFQFELSRKTLNAQRSTSNVE